MGSLGPSAEASETTVSLFLVNLNFISSVGNMRWSQKIRGIHCERNVMEFQSGREPWVHRGQKLLKD